MLKRLTEPSTYAGLAATLYGGSQLPPFNGQIITDSLAGGPGGIFQGLLMVGFGLLSMFLKEKGSRY